MIPDYRTENPYQKLIADELTKRGVRVVFPKGGRRIFPLLQAARHERCNIVHLHWITPFLHDAIAPVYVLYAIRLILDIALTRINNIRVVWTIHNKISHDARHPKLEMLVQRIIANIVNTMIVHSAEIRREISVNLKKPISSFYVIPHLSYAHIYGEAPNTVESRRQLNLKPTGRIFLNFGLMKPYKGLQKLLESWSASELGHQGNTLLLAGKFMNPAFQSEITATASSIAGVRIDAGFVPNGHVRLYFGACDAVVLPFERILTSGSLHLAITFGKPLIIPNIAALSDILQDADTFVYDSDNPTGLTQALRRCATIDLDQEQIKMDAIRQSLSSPADVAEATLQVYKDTMF